MPWRDIGKTALKTPKKSPHSGSTPEGVRKLGVQWGSLNPMKPPNPRFTLSTLPAHLIYHTFPQFTYPHPRPHTTEHKPLYPYPPPHLPTDAPRITTCASASPPKPSANARLGHPAEPPKDHRRPTPARPAKLALSRASPTRPPTRRCRRRWCGWMAQGWRSTRRLMRRFVGFVRIGRRWCWRMVVGGRRRVVGASWARAYADEGRWWV